MAWAQHRGIAKVEVQVDDGEWQDATLAGEDNIDTWRQWVYEWDATSPAPTRSSAARSTAPATRRSEQIHGIAPGRLDGLALA